MKLLLLIHCFVLGVSAVAGAGPVFWMTFSRGARYGFLDGLASACGAAVGDMLLAFLGLAGVLNFIQGSPYIFMILDVVAGSFLILLGFRMLRGFVAMGPIEFSPRSYSYACFRSFFLTVANPLGILYFVVVSSKIFLYLEHTCWLTLCIASFVLGLGSFVALALVAFVASREIVTVNKYYLNKVSFYSGLLLMLFGVYFLGDFVALLSARF